MPDCANVLPGGGNGVEFGLQEFQVQGKIQDSQIRAGGSRGGFHLLRIENKARAHGGAGETELGYETATVGCCGRHFGND